MPEMALVSPQLFAATYMYVTEHQMDMHMLYNPPVQSFKSNV